MEKRQNKLYRSIIKKNGTHLKFVPKWKVDWDAGNNSTGAGIYNISNIDPSSKKYYNLPSFNLENSNGIEVSTAIHGTPIQRRKYYNNGDMNDNRQSYGCVNGTCKMLKELHNKHKLQKGTKVYILPEDEGNEFDYVDEELVFRTTDENNVKYLAYQDKKGNVQKGQGINYSKNKINYSPLSIELKEDEFKDRFFTALDINDEKELENTKSFVNTLSKVKKKVLEQTGINSDVYDNIAKVAVGIYGVESNFGDTHSAVGNFFRAANKYLDKDNSSPDVESKYYTYGVDGDDNSIGYTQIRWRFLDNDDKKTLKKFGIKSKEDFLDIDKAALSTVLLLVNRYKYQLDNKEKKNVIDNLPKTWNNRENYTKRVKEHSDYFNYIIK